MDLLQKEKLEYPGELTLEALSLLDIYTKQICNVSATSRKLNKSYIQVRKFLKQPYVRELFQLSLLKKNVTPDRIAEVIDAGLSASNGVYSEGEHIADEPNWNARQKFAQLAAEVFEVLKYNVKSETTVNNNVVILQGQDRTEYEAIRGKIAITKREAIIDGERS